jgi:hypothetical protein
MMYIILSIILVAVITCMICCARTSVIPFDSTFTQPSTFEGYSNIIDNSKSDLYNQYLINKPDASCDKILGFNGIQCNTNEDNLRLDMFSNAVGKLDCKNSSGLSNSRGPLCLSDTHINLLKTRGGNIGNCGNAEIGH